MSDVLVLNSSLVDSEKFTGNEGLFHPIDIPPQSATNKCGIEPSTKTTLRAAVGDTDDASAGVDANFADVEALLDAALLDDYSSDEDRDDGLDDDQDGDNSLNDDQDNEAPEATAASEVADKMDVDEEIKTPRLPYDRCRTVAQFQAGCVWTRDDWSCAYDAVFMAFFTIYWQSSASWRGNWKQRSPEWTVRLSDRFDLLLDASNSPNHSPKTLSEWFSSLRDQFRDQLSSHDPQKFPRRGPFLASVCAILELLFGSAHRPGIEQHLFCANCRTKSQVSHHFPFLAFPFFPTNYRRDTDPRFVPAGTLLARFVESLVTPSNPPQCRVCHGTMQVQFLSMSDFPWMWFEINGNNTMSPSPTMPIELFGQRLVYDLYSVIYSGENHFTAHMRDPSNEWWSYDGMWRFGSP